MPTIPALMRAVVVSEAGGPLRPVQLPTPQPGPGEVLVRVAASAVNPLDTKIRAGKAAHARHVLPAVLGLDTAGIVAAVGAGVTGFAPGDSVFGMTGGVGGHQGSLAEYIAADARLLARAPANLSLREAAALPLAFITAWEGLIDQAHLKEGQSLLVQGGAGGVGAMAIQIAKARGTRIFATGSASSREAIELLGAGFIDRAEPVDAYTARLTGGRGFDVVYDTAGGTALDASFSAVRRAGHVVSCLGWGTHALAPLSFRAATYSGVFTLLPLLTGEGRQRHGEILTEAAKLAEAGQLVPRLDARRLTLESVGEAYDAIEQGTARGKLVIDIGEGK